jgi:malate dehydrogenase (oxaloacetate-decarboxylating)
MAAGVKNIVGCDQTGALYRGRKRNMNWMKDWYAQNTNPNIEQGTVHDVIKGADVFLGLSVPGVIDAEDVQNMAEKPIVYFAMAQSDAGGVHARRRGPAVNVAGDGNPDVPTPSEPDSTNRAPVFRASFSASCSRLPRTATY